MFYCGYRESILCNECRKAGISNHVKAGRDYATFVDKCDAELAAGKKFERNRLASVQANAGYFEDTVDSGLTFEHCVTMSDLSFCVKNHCLCASILG